MAMGVALRLFCCYKFVAKTHRLAYGMRKPLFFDLTFA